MRRQAIVTAVVVGGMAIACAQGAGPAQQTAARRDPPASMAALGDSITRGLGACIRAEDCPSRSWTTGDDRSVPSHYQRILKVNSKILGNAHNLARVQVGVADLPRQAAEAVRHKVAYLTILIGGNDVCTRSVATMTTAATFRRHLDQALNTLKAGLPNAKILLVSVPDLYRIWEVAHTNRTALSRWRHGICPALLANPTSRTTADTARRLQVRKRVEEFNRELSRACTRYGRTCQYDGGAAHRFRFGVSHLSVIDYFHPSAAGQRELSRVTYAAGFGW